MRLENKYKKFANLNTSTLSFPKRILKFKRSKWKNCQKRISIDSKTLQILNNPLIYKLSPRSVENVNNYYKDGLTLKNFLILFFDNSFKVSFFKNQLSSKNSKSLKDLLINFFIKPCFRVDVLLWKLNFFSTSFFARQYINEGKILINSKRVKSNFFVKKGDIISFKEESMDVFFKFLNLTSNTQIYTFVEFDNYLKRLVIVKDLTEFSNEDLNLMVKHFFDANKLKDYISK